MELNPYAKYLGGQDPRAVIAATPGLLHTMACELTPEQVAAPTAPGKWSVCQMVAHMADCEAVFCFRLRQTLAEPHPVLQPFDQEVWAEHYAGYDLPSGLEMFRAARVWNVKLIGGLGEAEMQREVTHPERGTMTFQTIVETMGGHDLNHLGQIEAYLKRLELR